MILLEGIGDVMLPCAAAIVLPGLVAALAAGRRSALGGVVFAATVGFGMWLRAGGLVTTPPREGLVALGFGLAAGAFLAGGWWSGLGAAMVGGMAVWMWQPCVGTHLGEALTTATRDPVAALLPLMAYGLGVSTVPVVVGLTLAGRQFVRTGRPARWGAAALGGLAVLAASGWYGEVVVRLFQWSSQG